MTDWYDNIYDIEKILEFKRKQAEQKNKKLKEQYKTFKIDLELFTKIVNEIRIHAFSEKKIENFLSSEILDNYAILKFGNNLVNVLLHILQLYFDPANYHDDIFDWYFYENTPKVMYEQDETEIDVETPERFYKWLVAEKKRLYGQP